MPDFESGVMLGGRVVVELMAKKSPVLQPFKDEAGNVIGEIVEYRVDPATDDPNPRCIDPRRAWLVAIVRLNEAGSATPSAPATSESSNGHSTTPIGLGASTPRP